MLKKFFIAIVLFFPVLVLAVDKININTASLTQLEELTGIGAKYAQAIIDARPFSSVDDLVKVKGIGPKTLQKIKNQGLACVNCQTQIQENIPIEIKTNIEATPTANYTSGVYINEILPNPKDSDEINEWIELYNSNNYDVDLSGWKLQDQEGSITTYSIKPNTKILANGYLVFKRPDTKIMLNNSEDGINLLTPDSKIIDSIGFTNAPLGQSYNKTGTGWQWSTNLTPGSKNIITFINNKTTNKNLPKSKNNDNNTNEKAELADISQSINLNQDTQNLNPWFLFFTALAITIILAVIVLLIKLKFKHVRT